MGLPFVRGSFHFSYDEEQCGVKREALSANGLAGAVSRCSDGYTVRKTGMCGREASFSHPTLCTRR